MGWGLGSLLRASLRAGWRPLVGLALLIAVAGGALLTGVEASRRTETAFDRMLIATNAWDVLVNPDEGTDSPLTFETVAALPMVEQAGRVDGVFLAPGHVDSFDDLEDGFTVFASDGVAGLRPGEARPDRGSTSRSRRRSTRSSCRPEPPRSRASASATCTPPAS